MRGMPRGAWQRYHRIDEHIPVPDRVISLIGRVFLGVTASYIRVDVAGREDVREVGRVALRRRQTVKVLHLMPVCTTPMDMFCRDSERLCKAFSKS